MYILNVCCSALSAGEGGGGVSMHQCNITQNYEPYIETCVNN